MVETSDLNVGAGLPTSDLPDGTAASQAAPDLEASAADLKRGYLLHPVERTSPFNEDVTGENTVGNPWEYGGFLGRPQGTAR